MNPKHPLIRNIATLHADGKSETAEPLVELLYDDALLLEGLCLSLLLWGVDCKRYSRARSRCCFAERLSRNSSRPPRMWSGLVNQKKYATNSASSVKMIAGRLL